VRSRNQGLLEVLTDLSRSMGVLEFSFFRFLERRVWWVDWN
jgi:hypothetical protein